MAATSTVIIPSGSTDPHMVSVSAGRSITLGMEFPVDGTYNVVAYLYSASAKPTRILHILEEGLTEGYCKSAIGSYAEIGFQFTAASSTDTEFESLGASK